MEEIWKDIKGFEGLYQISNYGSVKALKCKEKEGRGNWRKKDKIIKQSEDKKGYLRVRIYKNSVLYTKKVHRLVAIAFIENPEKKSQVNHIDENKKNNNANNLEWCDNKYNCNYGTRTKRATKSNINKETTSVPVLCIETNIIYPSINEAIRKTGATNIFYCCIGKRKTAGGYHWKYATNIRRIKNKCVTQI